MSVEPILQDVSTLGDNVNELVTKSPLPPPSDAGEDEKDSAIDSDNKADTGSVVADDATA